MKAKRRGKIVAGGMLRQGTPVEDWREKYGCYVKREDLACVKPGPPFSKARGVYARIKSRKEKVIGVLDTYHSQAGWAVARACEILGKKCVNYYPEYKYEPGWRDSQERALELGSELVGLPAGRSCILFHAAKKDLELRGGGYMMPNALKLEESVIETAKEVPELGRFDYVIVPISSGTIAAGVIRGFANRVRMPHFLIHLGYSRPAGAVRKYLEKASGVKDFECMIVDEEYTYKDVARGNVCVPWPCDPYYDLKAFRWWLRHRKSYKGKTLFWNIG